MIRLLLRHEHGKRLAAAIDNHGDISALRAVACLGHGRQIHAHFGRREEPLPRHRRSLGRRGLKSAENG
jgi:hypothetical protein